MTKTEIWCLAHKQIDYDIPSNTLQCGAAVNPKAGGMIGDDTGDNISDKNLFYCENTGIYWIWKNRKADIKGHYQYRRRLIVDNVEEILETNDVITCKPLILGCTVYQQYYYCHNVYDLCLCEMVIKDFYPDYVEDWSKYIMGGHTLYYSNGFIAKREIYDAYCEWLFSILDEVWKRKGFKDIDELSDYVDNHPELYRFVPSRGAYYQKTIGGFLSERLFTLYILHNFKHIYEVPYTLMEDTGI